GRPLVGRDASRPFSSSFARFPDRRSHHAGYVSRPPARPSSLEDRGADASRRPERAPPCHAPHPSPSTLHLPSASEPSAGQMPGGGRGVDQMAGSHGVEDMLGPTERDAGVEAPNVGGDTPNVALGSALDVGPSSPKAVADRVASAAPCDVVVAADLDAPFIGPASVYGRGLAEEAAWRTAIRVAVAVAQANPRIRGEGWAGSLTELTGGRGDAAILGGTRSVLVILRTEGGKPRTLVVAARREGEFSDSERRAMTAAAARPEPRDPVVIAALEAIAARTGVPLGVLHAGKMMWAAASLWRALG